MDISGAYAHPGGEMIMDKRHYQFAEFQPLHPPMVSVVEIPVKAGAAGNIKYTKIKIPLSTCLG